MNKKKFILSIVLGTLLANGIYATTPLKEVEPFDVSSIEYIEEEIQIDLGFDPADYLPENFDPYKAYFDLDSIEFVEEEFKQSKRMIRKLKRKLPAAFDAYAFPTDVQSINYIDENDSFTVDFDTKKHLPKDFNPYIK